MIFQQSPWVVLCVLCSGRYPFDTRQQAEDFEKSHDCQRHNQMSRQTQPKDYVVY